LPDAAIARTDLGGKLDTAGNLSADGILGPYGEKEGSYYTVREIWSPVQIPEASLSAGFTGTLPVENHYDFTPLQACDFHWRLLEFPAPSSATAEASVRAEGHLSGPPVDPGDSGHLALPLPTDWATADALELTATGPDGEEIMRWSWPIRVGEPLASVTAAKPQPKDAAPFDVQIGEVLWSFSPETGQLLSCSVGGEATGLGRGPFLSATGEAGPLDFDHAWEAELSRQGDTVVIESKSRKDDASFRWTLSPGGLVELSYTFAPIDAALTSCAVGFELPDASVRSKRWLGAGPYRVWANQMRGPQFGLWANDYNDAVTGHIWEYPEFKGVFDQVDWMQLNLKTGATLLLDTEPGSQIGVLRPANRVVLPEESEELMGPAKATWDYPGEGGLFLFHKVPAIGTKFRTPAELGPQSQPKVISGPIRGSLIFHVR